jgi:hypothetical protein
VIDVRKFVVESTEGGALLMLSTWNRHEELRVSLAEGHIYDDDTTARATCAALIKQAEDESPFGCKVPCDEHSRCVGFDPQVWEVHLSVTPVTG